MSAGKIYSFDAAPGLNCDGQNASLEPSSKLLAYHGQKSFFIRACPPLVKKSFFAERTHLEKLWTPYKSMRNEKYSVALAQKTNPFPVLLVQCIHSRRHKFIKGYSSPFNPIQGFLEKKKIVYFFRLAGGHVVWLGA
jgi:hypothetical protein